MTNTSHVCSDCQDETRPSPAPSPSGEKWVRNGFVEVQDSLPPPNFVITNKDLENTAQTM